MATAADEGPPHPPSANELQSNLSSAVKLQFVRGQSSAVGAELGGVGGKQPVHGRADLGDGILEVRERVERASRSSFQTTTTSSSRNWNNRTGSEHQRVPLEGPVLDAIRDSPPFVDLLRA